MTRPLLEVADIVRAQGDRFLQHNFRWMVLTGKCCARSLAAAPRHSVGIVISALAVAIAPPLITVALWGVFSNGEWNSKRARRTRGHALSTLH
jgi:hypothetical protein